MDECRKALEALLKRHIDLVNSGDAGFWDPEREPEVIEARKALARTEAKVSGEDVCLHGCSGEYPDWCFDPDCSFCLNEGKPSKKTPSEVKWSSVKEVENNMDGMEEWVRRDEAEAMIRQLPAPQSPVVPGVEELRQKIFDAHVEWGGAESIDISTADFVAKAIHAHLLANARESRYTLADLELMWGHGKRDVPLSEALATVGKEG